MFIRKSVFCFMAMVVLVLNTAGTPIYGNDYSNSSDMEKYGASGSKQEAERPNIVWIMGEDCSKHWFKLFDNDYGIETPNINSLAKDGLMFSNTFCNVAVCSAARSSLISSCYPSRAGLQWHRRIEFANLPDGLERFPKYMRDAGYYTTNSTKTDYNCTGAGAWDNAAAGVYAWRDRPSPDMPFFHVRTFTISHESKVRGKLSSPQTSLDSVKLYPVHPDTRQFRKTYATYFDRIRDLDRLVGDMVKAIKEDGLYDNTFIFFIGDNGGTMPGSKGYITETGLHVPLVVHVPERFKHLSPQGQGGKISGFVSFVDFGATSLNLAGIEIPAGMDGRPFLGKGISPADLNARDEVLCSSDRFDELYLLVRSFRKGKYKYVRNYEPFVPYSLQNNYRMGIQSFVQWRDMFKAGNLTAAQALFFEPRSGHELYDLEKDPFETNNLAEKPEYASVLSEMQKKLYDRVVSMPDLGIIPESVFLKENGIKDPGEYGRENKARIRRYVDIADLMLKPYGEARNGIISAIKSSDPIARFWSMTVCAAFGNTAIEFEKEAIEMSGDSSPLTRVRAMVFLAEMGSEYKIEPVIKRALQDCSHGAETLKILGDVVHLQDDLGYKFTTIIKSDIYKGGVGLVDNRVSYLGW